jgi:hypothetical protein
VSDGRSHTLKKADIVEVESELNRYGETADKLEDAVVKLKKIVDGASDSLVGKYVEKLQDDAKKIQDDLTKAGKRYRDAANEIGIYKPQLEVAIKELSTYETSTADAEANLTRANGMPDPQKGEDGKISTEEQDKGNAKQGKIDEANGALTAASDRLTRALDALDVAGKTLGDKVNCNNYDDGLTDSTKDKILEAFQWISYIFGKLALVFTVLAFLIPGLQVLAIAALVVGAVLLVSDSVLFANGMAKWSDVFLDALGLGLGGLGAAFSKVAGTLGRLGKLFGGPKPAGNGIVDLTEGGTMIVAPKPGFWAGESQAFKNTWDAWKTFLTGPTGGNPWKLGKAYLQNIIDNGTLEELIAAGFDFKKYWWAWGLGNMGLNLGAGIGYAGYQINQGGKNPTA